MRHVLGYVLCLGFLTLALPYFGLYTNLVSPGEMRVAAVIETLKFDPVIGHALQYTVQVAGASFSPLLMLGHLAAIVFSLVGFLALVLYALLAWILPA
jgi:hypothetical protein